MSRETLTLIRRTIQPRRGQAWHGGPTPVGALRGVTAAQARWTPPGGRQSIWRLTLHIAYWKYTVRRHLVGGSIPRFPRSPANFPALPARPDERAWKADRDLLAEEHRLLLRGLERLDPRVLRRRPPGAKRWTWEEMVIGVLLHDVYHTGQIQLLKRLWRKGK
jgi:hypothetical protein